MNKNATSIVEGIGNCNSQVEEELAGDEGIIVETSLAYESVDLLCRLPGLAVCQKRDAEILCAVHSLQFLHTILTTFAMKEGYIGTVE